MQGKILNDRYKIIEEIGSGGMADVYKAYDQRLGRYVAIKVLKPDLSRDREFIHRFYREAVNAAKLSHPNIVNVYDIEEEANLHFIVMEYLEGAQNLKSYITKLKKPLATEQLISIVRDILKALTFAHQKGIIHRDLKPHNILITKDNIIKVTDFGIAKALFSDTLTQTGSIIGSVHYFSPEQAQGKPTTAPADIYSLGILMFEIMTGQLPFNGENPVTIALKHVQEPPPRPSDIRKDLSPEIEKIILKALQKDPLMRYQNSEEMMADLERIIAGRPVKNALPTPEPTLLAPPSKKQKEIEEVSHHLKSRREELRDGEDTESRESSVLKGVVTFTLLLLLAGFIVVAFLYGSRFLQEVETPDIIGKTITDAQVILTEKGLNIVVQNEVFSDEKPEGIILKQSPFPGEKIRPGKRIYVTISKGNKTVEVPDLVGVKLEKAKQILNDRGLSKFNVTEVFSDVVQVGIVISQEPLPQNRVLLSSTIFLKVSKGPVKAKIPDLTSKTKDEALKLLTKLELKLVEDGTEPSSQIPAGKIIRQDPPAGSMLVKDSVVKVVISKGLEGLTSPNLVGKTIIEAQGIIEPLGVTLKIEGEEKGQNAIITSQEPPAGELIEDKIITVRAENLAIVPALIGKKLQDARDLAIKRGFEVGNITYKEVNDAAPDIVIDQDPQAGIEESQGARINIVVARALSSTPTLSPVPGTPEPSPEISPRSP